MIKIPTLLSCVKEMKKGMMTEGVEQRGGQERKGFFARMKNERERVSEIRMIGAVKEGGRASWSGKHFTDICPDSGRHKRV